jgi:hypothetical protein
MCRKTKNKRCAFFLKMLCENFEIAMKNCQEMWLLYFRKTLENLTHAQLREMHRKQVIIRYANFKRTSKILVAFSNENLFVDAAAKGHFSGYVRLPKNFRSPCCDFASPIAIEKLINAEGLILVKLARVSIQDSSGCCTFQRPLVYNRVC